MESLSLPEIEEEARRRLDPAIYDFFAGGAADEVTTRANETTFARIGLLPRVLRGGQARELAVTLLGRRIAQPVIVAPTAFHRLAHPDGERATARAAAKAGLIMVVSMASTVAIEGLAETGADLWFQLYVQPDLGFTERLVRRAEAAGCAAVVVSVDSPVFGRRERDLRNGFLDLPPGMACAHMEGRPIAFRPDLSWDHLDWLRSVTALPIVLKGVVHPEDARLAVDRGIDAIAVSNHGGRQLDTVPATIELLPPVADAVGGTVPLLLDGGVRRGTDVLKALALGADAVAIGRPVLWGLTVDGEAGVARVLDMLRAELDQAAVASAGLSSPKPRRSSTSCSCWCQSRNRRRASSPPCWHVLPLRLRTAAHGFDCYGQRRSWPPRCLPPAQYGGARPTTASLRATTVIRLRSRTDTI
jgi:4-hydroxymandelate oxidase